MGDVVRPSQFRAKPPARIADADLARRVIMLFHGLSMMTAGGIGGRRMARIIGAIYVFALRTMSPPETRRSFEGLANSFQKHFESVDRLWSASPSEKRPMDSAGINGKP